jgi:hypothetical protein
MHRLENLLTSRARSIFGALKANLAKEQFSACRLKTRNLKSICLACTRDLQNNPTLLQFTFSVSQRLPKTTLILSSLQLLFAFTGESHQCRNDFFLSPLPVFLLWLAFFFVFSMKTQQGTQGEKIMEQFI